MGVPWRTEMKGCLGRAAPYPYPFVDESHASVLAAAVNFVRCAVPASTPLLYGAV